MVGRLVSARMDGLAILVVFKEHAQVTVVLDN